VTGALEPALKKLSTMLGNEYKLFKGMRGEIRFLINELAGVHAFILKLSEQEDLDMQDKVWMMEVRELSYDIDDSIDEFMQHVDNKVIEPYGIIEKIRNSIGKLRKMEAHTSSEFKDLQKQITEISKRYALYKSGEGLSCTRNVIVNNKPLAIFKHMSELVGIDGPKTEIQRLLTEEDGCASTQGLKMVSIVGPGGIGKTTLAYQLYQQLKVDFECWAFVSISLKSDMMTILRDVFNQVSNQPYVNTEFHSIEQLILKISNFLENKRYYLYCFSLVVFECIKKSAMPHENYTNSFI
jgi:disease resistance protein RPM1